MSPLLTGDRGVRVQLHDFADLAQRGFATAVDQVSGGDGGRLPNSAAHVALTRPAHDLAGPVPRAAAGERKSALAKEFGVSRETVYSYLRTASADTPAAAVTG